MWLVVMREEERREWRARVMARRRKKVSLRSWIRVGVLVKKRPMFELLCFACLKSELLFIVALVCGGREREEEGFIWGLVLVCLFVGVKCWERNHICIEDIQPKALH